MVAMIRPFLLCLFLAGQAFALPEIIATASTEEKGFVAESIMEDIYTKTGRTSVFQKWDPNVHGPDKIFRTPNGNIEIHEVKGYTSWAGKSAMQTTAEGRATYELSRDWLDVWIKNTLTDPLASEADRQTATIVQNAVKEGRVSFIYDEVNFTTGQYRTSTVTQIGRNDVQLAERAGPQSIERLERKFAEKTRRLQQLRLENRTGKFMKNATTKTLKEPLSREGIEKLRDSIAREAKTNPSVNAGLLAEDGRLFVAFGEGAMAGFLVFGLDSAVSFYHYKAGDIHWADFQREVQDAAFKGGVVGSCVAVSVFLGATPAGWVVLGVSTGAYFVADMAATAWHDYHDRGLLTMDDLRAWGLDGVESILTLPNDGILTIDSDDSILHVDRNGGILSF